MKIIKSTLMALAMGLAFVSFDSPVALADSHGSHAKVMAKDAWARSRTPTAKVGGAFMTLHNMGKEDDRLIDARSPISSRTEVHTTKMTDGVMKMIHLKDGIEVNAGETVMMKPGGYHVMFMGLKEPMSEGKTFPVTLVFEKSGEVEVMVSVKKAGTMGGMKHGKTDHDKMGKEKMKKMN